MTPTLISVVNRSAKVSDADVEKMTLAVGKQLARDASPVIGLVPAMEFVRAGGKPSDGSCLCEMLDVPDMPGALGYHGQDDHGVPFIKCFTITGQVLKGANALSVTLSHEALELTWDPAANRWADGPDGNDFAMELADACEGDTYEIDGVAVSNFLLPDFFNPQASANSRLDFMGVLSKPFSMSPGGYQITRTEPGRVTQVFASHAGLCRLEAAPGLHVLFGPDFDPERREHKVANALKKRGGRGRGRQVAT